MKKRVYIRYLTVFLTLLTILVSSPAAGLAQNIIKIKGSSAVLPVIEACFENFLDKHPDINIAVQGTDSTTGIASLINGTCHIANSSRAIEDEELYKSIMNGIDTRGYAVAMDGISLIVNPSNPIKAITKQQIKDIYIGKISNWKKLCGDVIKIVVISQEKTSDTFQTFSKFALDEKKVRSDIMLQTSDQAVIKTVSDTPGAIGYVKLGNVTNKVKAIKLNGIMPSRKTVLSGDYLLAKPLYMYTNGKPKGKVRDFIEFILSKDGQKLIEKKGFIGFQ